MAKQDKGMQDTSKSLSNAFIKGLNKDSDPSFVTEGMWTHSVNAVNNTIEGDVGSLSNESSNYLCGTTATTMPANVIEKYIIGSIYLYSDKWIIFTVGHGVNGLRVSSEIGLYEEDRCLYRPIVQDACLEFDKHYLISGASRENEDCSWQIYWADGLNPDRYLNIGDPQTWPSSDYVWAGQPNINYYTNGPTNILWPGVKWVDECKDENNVILPGPPGYEPFGCLECKKQNKLDCPKTRLARLMETPCLTLTLGNSGGTLQNGTYFAVIAYTIKGQRVTNYFSQSNNQFIFYPSDLQGSLIIEVNADQENFDEFVLVLVQNINEGTVAKQIGFYSTKTTRIAIDQIPPSLITVPLEQLPLQLPVYETSDQMTDVNNYLLRVGPKSKFDFNYQPLANLIRANWASVEYPGDYYMKGGSKTSYLRDEVYAFFIRWVYDTGDKSSSYHIPGRPPNNFILPTTGVSTPETLVLTNLDSLSNDDKVFEVYNTANITPYPTVLPDATLVNGQWVLPDGGVLLASGTMGYWESTEKYPDNRPDIWNSSEYCWTGPAGQDKIAGKYVNDLCGKYIRHHKFPENFINNSPSTSAVHFRPNTNLTNSTDE